MLNFSILAADAGNAGAMSSPVFLLIWIGVLVVLFYFIAIRPQKKQQKQMDAMMSSLEVGDCVVTTAGFYGEVIDIMDEVVVVEFGSNRNCRIPMKKSAIVEVEKPGGIRPEDTEDKSDKKKKKLTEKE